ncbi:MAG: YihY/virulence factor BrkB family protein [Bacteroidetes bacterium]|nr:MAG: YihY/virulence factor BrkB family protein [Bacteroidota bacterium]
MMQRLKHIVLRQKPIKWLVQRAQRYHPPGFAGLPLYSVLKFFIEKAQNVGFSTRAAAISFNILMALPAGLIFLCTLVPYLPAAVDAEKNLLAALNDVLLDKNTYRVMAGIIHDFFGTPRRGLLSFSAMAAIFFSSNAIMGIIRAFDHSYFEARSSIFLSKRWTAIKLTSFLILFVIATVLLLSVQGAVQTFFLKKLHINTPTVRWIIQILRWATLLLLNYLSIAAIYRVAPAVKNRWPLGSPGAILACFLTVTTTLGFSIWVSAFGRFNEIYGSIGTVLILMNLLYINSLVLLIGFELNVSIAALKTHANALAAGEGKADGRPVV